MMRSHLHSEVTTIY